MVSVTRDQGSPQGHDVVPTPRFTDEFYLIGRTMQKGGESWSRAKSTRSTQAIYWTRPGDPFALAQGSADL